MNFVTQRNKERQAYELVPTADPDLVEVNHTNVQKYGKKNSNFTKSFFCSVEPKVRQFVKSGINYLNKDFSFLLIFWYYGTMFFFSF
jgi:hypothetical protein